jgi:hypothetical protein
MEVTTKKNHTIDELASSMTEDEYRKAKEFYKFLVNITKCTKGILSIDRSKFVDIAAAYMNCTPWEAHIILTKMKSYGWIKVLDKDFVIINLEKA